MKENKITKKQIRWGAFKSKFFAGAMNCLNTLYFTNRRNNKIRVIKNIKYKEDKKCTFDIAYINNYPQKKLPTIFYIHGGSYIANDKSQFMHLVKDLADKGFLVVNINYRLVPQVYIKDCLTDCQNAINYALETCDRIDQNNCFIAGDSAGANLAAQVMLSLNEKTFKPTTKLTIRALALYYGLYDVSLVDSRLTKPFILGLYEYKYYDKEIKDFSREIDVLKRMTPKFAPSLIISSDNDFIKQNSFAMIKRCQELDIDHEYIIFKKSFFSAHGFLNIKNTKVYNTALQGVIDFFKDHQKEVDK